MTQPDGTELPCGATDEFGGTCDYREGHSVRGVVPHFFVGGDTQARDQDAMARFHVEKAKMYPWPKKK